jgi:hypothetical protein
MAVVLKICVVRTASSDHLLFTRCALHHRVLSVLRLDSGEGRFPSRAVFHEAALCHLCWEQACGCRHAAAGEAPLFPQSRRVLPIGLFLFFLVFCLV